MHSNNCTNLLILDNCPITTIALAFSTSFIIVFFAIPSVIKIAKEKNLNDVPEDRKCHNNSTPTLGGIAIFGGLFIAATLWVKIYEMPYLQYILAASCIIFFIGAKDDIFPLVPYKKIISEILACLIVIIIGEIRLTSLYGVFGIYEINYISSVLLSLFTFIVIINSINLIDGINGLAGSVGVLIISSFGLWFYVSGSYQLVVFSSGLIGGLIAFLYYNFTPSKIFMGDTGSLLIGFFCSFLAIKFIEGNQQIAFQKWYYIESAPAVAMGILSLPLYDTLRVIFIRLLKKKSPFKADKNHTHHLFIRKGFNHTITVILLCFINSLIIGFCLFFNKQGSLLLAIYSYSIVILIFLFVEFFIPNNIYSKRQLKSFKMTKPLLKTRIIRLKKLMLK